MGTEHVREGVSHLWGLLLVIPHGEFLYKEPGFAHFFAWHGVSAHDAAPLASRGFQAEQMRPGEGRGALEKQPQKATPEAAPGYDRARQSPPAAPRRGSPRGSERQRPHLLQVLVDGDVRHALLTARPPSWRRPARRFRRSLRHFLRGSRSRPAGRPPSGARARAPPPARRITWSPAAPLSRPRRRAGGVASRRQPRGTRGGRGLAGTTCGGACGASVGGAEGRGVGGCAARL